MATPKYPTPVSASMETQPESSLLREMHPEDNYPGGGYYSSPFGRTKYWIVGPVGGQKVALIHGITVPAFVYKHIVDALVKEGCQVLLYDLYGRGYSEATDGPQDPNLYILQLALLLQYVKWQSADIIGFSMGGAIAAAFAASFPHLVSEHVVFLAAAGLMESNVVHAGSTPSPSVTEKNPELVAKVNEIALKFRTLQFELLPAARRVFDASRADGVITGLHWAYDTLGKTSTKRFLIVHGTADKIVPYTEAFKIQRLVPQAKLVPIEGASHYLPLEDQAWQQVVDSIVPFLKNTEGRRSQR